MSSLAGLRVLDLSRLLPGGFCSLLLRDHGAEVIKVEDTGDGDYLRWAPGEPRDGLTLGPMFRALNRGKRSIRIDLKTDGGREALLRLAMRSDVLLESFRPGVMDRLGLGYDRLREDNPRLVYCAITGYGQHGPLARRSGHDLNYLARTGVLDLTGERHGPPTPPAVPIADIGGGALMATVGILVALRERDRSGEGQFVDVSMAHGTLSQLALQAARFFGDGAVPTRGTLDLTGGLICYRPYRCADGWVALGAVEPKFWRAWCAGVGRDDLIARQYDPVGSDAHDEITRIFAARTRAEWEAFAAEHDCCLDPVLTLDEALASELAQDMVVEAEQPGGRPLRQLGSPIRLSRTPAEESLTGAPELGADTHDVLREIGYREEDIDVLEAAGAILGTLRSRSRA